MVAGTPFLNGKINVDKTYFGGLRKGPPGRGATGNAPVFGRFKRGGRMYTVVIEGAIIRRLMGMIRGRIQPDRILYTDSFYSHCRLEIRL
jgi:transposase